MRWVLIVLFGTILWLGISMVLDAARCMIAGGAPVQGVALQVWCLEQPRNLRNEK